MTPQPPAFRLRFPTSQIDRWADRYSYTGEEAVVEQLTPPIRERGYMHRSEFLDLCEWKSPRTRRLCAANDESTVQEATRVALSSTEEVLKIGILRVLQGVAWPTASVILHFCDRGAYPILDYRALWSLSVKEPSQYTFGFWWSYTTYVRDLGTRTGKSMRTIDRALWQYSKVKQRG